MGTLKKFAKYIIWIVLFWFFTDILIFFGLNANYDKLTTSNNSNIPSQVEVEQAEATLVNDRIKGKIKNDGEEDLNGKYMKVDLYSPGDVLLGTKYMKISDLEKGASDDFELFFKAQDVDHYDISFVDKIEEKEDDIIDKGIKAITSLKDIKSIDDLKNFRINTEFMDHKISNRDIFFLILFLAIIGV